MVVTQAAATKRVRIGFARFWRGASAQELTAAGLRAYGVAVAKYLTANIRPPPLTSLSRDQ
jgi:hypothetical protein